MSATSDAITSGVVGGVISGAVAGAFTARAVVNKLKSKVTGDHNIVAQGVTGTVHIYASPEPPQPRESNKIGPYLVPYRVGEKFHIRNAGDDDAFDATWLASAVGGEPSVIPSGTDLPNPMRPLIDTIVGLNARTFGSGVTTIDVTWKDRNGGTSSNRLNV